MFRLSTKALSAPGRSDQGPRPARSAHFLCELRSVRAAAHYVRQINDKYLPSRGAGGAKALHGVTAHRALAASGTKADLGARVWC